MSLRRDLDLLQTNLLLPETEETWDRIANSINALIDLCHNGTCDSPEEFVPAMKAFSRPLTSALHSERTRLSGPAIELVAAAAIGLGSEFEPLLPMYFPPLLALCSRTNKVVLARAKTCILTIIQSTQLPSVLPLLLQHAKDKASTLRLVVAEGALACLNCFNPPDLEKEARAKDVESLIRIAAKDATADVRRVSRELFEAYKLLLPGRVASFTAPLSPTSKKYLDIKVACSGSGTVIHRPQSSLAASTSSLRSSRSTIAAPPERPKSSSSSLKDHTTALSKPTESKTRYRPPTISPPAIVATQARKDEARRVPIFQSQTNIDSKSTSTRSAPVKAGVMNGAECQPFGSQTSSGPKRILLPEVPIQAQTQPRAGNQSDSSLKSLPSRKPMTTPRVVEKEKSRNPSHTQPTTQTSTEPKNESKRAPRSVFQPTKSQLAKVVVAKGKPPPVKGSKRRTVSKNTTILEMTDGTNEACEAAQIPLPPSRSSTPMNVVQPADNVEKTNGLDDDHELPLVPRSDEGTPRKTEREGKADDPLITKTPITILLTSIEQGFLHSPFSPLSPPQSYLNREGVIDVEPFPLRLSKKVSEPHEKNEQSF